MGAVLGLCSAAQVSVVAMKKTEISHHLKKLRSFFDGVKKTKINI